MSKFNEIINSDIPVLIDFFCPLVSTMQNDASNIKRSKKAAW